MREPMRQGHDVCVDVAVVLFRVILAVAMVAMALHCMHMEYVDVMTGAVH